MIVSIIIRNSTFPLTNNLNFISTITLHSTLFGKNEKIVISERGLKTDYELHMPNCETKADESEVET